MQKQNYQNFTDETINEEIAVGIPVNLTELQNLPVPPQPQQTMGAYPMGHGDRMQGYLPGGPAPLMPMQPAPQMLTITNSNGYLLYDSVQLTIRNLLASGVPAATLLFRLWWTRRQAMPLTSGQEFFSAVWVPSVFVFPSLPTNAWTRTITAPTVGSMLSGSIKDTSNVIEW